MQKLIIIVLIISFVSPCLCVSWTLETKNTSYNVMDYGAKGDGKYDDSEAFLSAWNHTCQTQGATLIVPSQGVFLVKNINFRGPCASTDIQIQLGGKIVAPTKDAWLNNNSTNPLILISNVNGVTVNGTGGLIDGFGSTWWKCIRCPRPGLIGFYSCNNVIVNYLSLTNSPIAHIKIHKCVGVRISHITISAPGNSPNTDGIDISYSQNISITDSKIASGDDCIAIIGVSSNINVTGIACGPGHGISIGSLGRNNSFNEVEQVYVNNCSFTNTTNGARIKTFTDGSGYAKSITYQNITLTQVRNSIIIDQYYHDLKESGIQVSDVTFRGFQGTSVDERAIILDCSSSGCTNIVLDQINIVSSNPAKPASCSCINAHGTATSTVPGCTCLLK